MKTICVTGLDGFIAGYAIEKLQDKGYEVIGNVRHTTNNPILKNVTQYNVDIRDSVGVYSMIEHCDGVIHLAGLLGTSENMKHSSKMTDVNINGTLNVLEAVENFHIPCVVIGVGNYWMNNPYAITKYAAEKFALMSAKAGNRVAVVRALNAFGPRQKYGRIFKIIPTFVTQALQNKPLKVYGGKKKCSSMDMIFVGDVAEVLVDTLYLLDTIPDRVIGKVIEAGTGYGYKVYDIAEKIIKLTKSKSEIVEVPMREGEDEESMVVANDPSHFPGTQEYCDKYFEKHLKETINYYKTLV